MKQRELARLHVLNNVLEYRIPIGQAAEILGVSERPASRLLNAYRKKRAAALAHGNQGRRPHSTVLESQSASVVRLASTKYAGTHHIHLNELLRERKGIDLSRPSVRLILAKAGTGGLLDPHLATLGTCEVDWDLRPRKSKARQHLTRILSQRALRDDVQQAKLRGLSLRAMARELGIHRNTVRRYALAESPPLRKKKRNRDSTARDGKICPNGHFRRPVGRTLYL